MRRSGAIGASSCANGGAHEFAKVRHGRIGHCDRHVRPKYQRKDPHRLLIILGLTLALDCPATSDECVGGDHRGHTTATWDKAGNGGGARRASLSTRPTGTVQATFSCCGQHDKRVSTTRSRGGRDCVTTSNGTTSSYVSRLLPRSRPLRAIAATPSRPARNEGYRRHPALLRGEHEHADHLDAGNGLQLTISITPSVTSAPTRLQRRPDRRRLRRHARRGLLRVQPSRDLGHIQRRDDPGVSLDLTALRAGPAHSDRVPGFPAGGATRDPHRRLDADKRHRLRTGWAHLIAINPAVTNHAPVATADSYTTAEDTGLSVSGPRRARRTTPTPTATLSADRTS